MVHGMHSAPFSPYRCLINDGPLFTDSAQRRKTMININGEIKIDESELHFEFVRSSGPGGQNVNKVSTAVQLRFNAGSSSSLPEEVFKRLKAFSGRQMTEKGILIIDTRRFRKQEQNRQDAINRLVKLLTKAAQRPKRRIKTRPTSGSIKRMKEEKQLRSRVKRMREDVSPQED